MADVAATWVITPPLAGAAETLDAPKIPKAIAASADRILIRIFDTTILHFAVPSTLVFKQSALICIKNGLTTKKPAKRTLSSRRVRVPRANSPSMVPAMGAHCSERSLSVKIVYAFVVRTARWKGDKRLGLLLLSTEARPVVQTANHRASRGRTLAGTNSLPVVLSNKQV
jgi:hypothetical protein